MATRTIPTDTEFRETVVFGTEPSTTFKVDFETKRIDGYTDKQEAMRQAVILALFTEQKRWIIHEPDYGVILSDLIGESMTTVIPLIEVRVRRALLADDRITDVYNFEFKKNFNPEKDPDKPKLHRNTLTCTFDVDTVFGHLSKIGVDIYV